MATIQEVAQRAGVGVGTVSRVINGSPLVSDRTRERVQAVIDEIGYRPSSLARALSLGRSSTLAAVVPFFTRPSTVERLQGVAEVLDESDYDLVLYDVHTADQRDRRLDAVTRTDRAGVLIFSLAPSETAVKGLAEASVPVVFADRRVEGLPHVWVDDVAGGRKATEHLIGLGHQRIAFVGDEYDECFGFTSSTDRRAGFHRALEDANMQVPSHFVRVAEHGRDQAHRLASELLQLAEPPTAIVAASDLQALGVLEAAADLGRSVPDDLSVIGYDDIDVARHVGLTTVKQPLQESGRYAARMLLDALAGEPDDAGLELDTNLVVRRTTSPPA